MKRTWHWLAVAIAAQGIVACAQPGGGMRTSSPVAANVARDTLTAYHWQLREAVNSTGVALKPPAGTNAGQPLQLTFSDQRVSVAGLCNNLGGGYQLNGDKIKISQVVGTMRMCADPALMQYERSVAERLPSVASWEITRDAARPDAASPGLKLTFADGAIWWLAGTPTSETKYGSAGEIQFLEIAPQPVPCNHPLIPNMQCMQVRSVTYDAAGIKQGHGEWEAFYGTIEGYTHTPGVRNIVRVKRYTLANPPADASRYVYVHDMTVESEQVPVR